MSVTPTGRTTWKQSVEVTEVVSKDGTRLKSIGGEFVRQGDLGLRSGHRSGPVG